MRILAISGSLRAVSGNGAVLEAATRLVPPGVEVALYGGLAGLPQFSPDLDVEPPPAPVAALRAAVAGADALLFATPEYAHGVPGSLKNALDWLVSGVEVPGKPVALWCASPPAPFALAQLEETLRVMSTRFVTEACLTIPLRGRKLDGAAIAADPLLAAPLRAALTALLRAAAGRPAR